LNLVRKKKKKKKKRRIEEGRRASKYRSAFGSRFLDICLSTSILSLVGALLPHDGNMQPTG
jgi:hypothetical protein